MHDQPLYGTALQIHTIVMEEAFYRETLYLILVHLESRRVQRYTSEPGSRPIQAFCCVGIKLVTWRCCYVVMWRQ
jgi:hypothetical protein